MNIPINDLELWLDLQEPHMLAHFQIPNGPLKFQL